jgi:3-oxoadipate enol-lactonase
MPKIKSNNINLYYEMHGEGQPLVFIHGLGSSTRDWESQVPEFSKSFKVVAFDLRGHGQSDKPAGPYTMSQYSDDLAGLLRALNITSAHIVGISLGGGIAFQFAIVHPTQVKTMTIVNSAPTLGDPAQVKPEIERRVGIVQQMGMRAMGQALAPALFPKPEHAALRETFIARWAENDPPAYMDATRALDGWDVTDKLGSIQIPTLVISADQDYTPVAVKEAYVKLMPDAQLVVIADAHHATPIERPQEFNAVLAQFLARHS